MFIGAKLMMFQTEYKYFNKKIKMLLFLLLGTLIWSLMGQQKPYGKSTTSDVGLLTAVVCTANDDFHYDTKNRGGNVQENIAEITMRCHERKSPSSTSRTAVATVAISEYKGKSKTIYSDFNENDNNSNKLPQNVTKRYQQQQQHANMMYINMIMPTTKKKNSQQSTSSFLPANSAGVARTAVSLLPATKLLRMPKAQFNKMQNSQISKRKTTKSKTENGIGKIFKVNSEHTRALHQAVESVNNNNISQSHVNEILNNLQNVNSGKRNLHRIKNLAKFTTFYSKAHVQHEFILQFALKFKQIPRITYFTCQTNDQLETKTNQNYNYERHASANMDTVEFVARMFASANLMIKVVLIDHLVSKNHVGMSNTMMRGGFVTAGAAIRQNTFTNINWLEQVLRPEPLRQLVILNLSCGLSSRRLLEMASNKAFFNSMYHWLLLEDYAFNRQTEIDDADDIESKMNSDSNSNQADINFKQEIVNDSNATNGQVKQLSTYSKDVDDGVFTSGSGPDKQNNVTATKPASTSSASKIRLRQQQYLPDSNNKSSSIASNASQAVLSDEDDMEITRIEKFLAKLNININTELVVAKRRTGNFQTTTTTSNPSQRLFNMMSASTDSHDYKMLQKMNYYLLYDVWNPGLQYGGVLNISKVGNFTRQDGLQLAKWYGSISTIRRRQNMQLARIRCLVVITHKNSSDTLEEYLSSHYDKHLDSMNRFNFALLTYVRDLFNFRFILSKTSTWGYLKNGKFDGMIGALVRKQADIGGSPIFFRIERAKVIDYTARTWVARPCFIFRHPRSTKKDRIVFLQPFSNEVWILLVACGCMTIVFLWLLKSLEGKFQHTQFDKMDGKNCPTELMHGRASSEHNHVADNKSALLVAIFQSYFLRFSMRNHVEPRTRWSLLFESLLFYVGSICQQGLSFSTFLISGRCIVIFSLLFSFAIYQFYSASIVSTLLMEKPKTIRTLRDLIHSSLEVGIEDIVYNRDYFLRTKDPNAQELYAKKLSSVPMTGETGFGDTSPPSRNDVIRLPIPLSELTGAQKAKAYRDILHSHETGAHAKTNDTSHWYDPDYGVDKIKQGRFAFHVDVATAYKIIADTFSEKEICELSEIQLFPPQKMVSIVQKGSPLRKMITYGLRRATEVGLTDYQRKVWHSPKPRCVKQLHTDDLKVDMQTFTSALWVLIIGYAVSLLILSIEIVHFKLRWQG